ncbi:YveK family protein [Metabacillus fastidiosus]|uniref:YveK family protein n=1 Tax=Metabacillus fastidiosus TaxID=1458 RepID=UPI003D2E2316
MQGEMNLKDFFQLIKRRMVLISVTAAIVVAITVLVISYTFKPVYEASEYILIGNLQNKNIENSYEETQKIPQMLASSVDFIKSPIILNAVKEELGLEGLALEEKLVIENNKNSQIITITVQDQDEKLARNMAKTTAVISIEKMNSLLQFDQVKILEKNDEIVKKNNGAAALAIALIIGIFSGIGLAVIREQWDHSIKRERAVEDLLDVPLLGRFNSKVEFRRSVQEDYPHAEHDDERGRYIVKEKKKQVDKATSIS